MLSLANSLEKLRRVLVNLQVITADQWIQAGGENYGLPIETILDNLQQLPAWYSSQLPAISEFQRNQIETRFQKGLRDLDRDLRVNSYLIISQLGRGGMAYVVRAWSLEMSREVAIKRITTNNAHLVDRQLRETRVLRRLDHPNIVKLLSHELIDDGDGSLIAMEVVEGETLQNYVGRIPFIATNVAIDWLIQILLAVQHAHSNGVIHRDLTWKNVMVAEEHDANAKKMKLLDFGLSKIIDASDSLTGTHQTMGTIQFMSPEQFDDSRSVTPASDVYSLGCLAYTILTKNPPFSGDKFLTQLRKHATEPPPPLTQFRSDLPPDLVASVTKMLAKKPQDRGTVSEHLRNLRFQPVVTAAAVSDPMAPSAKKTSPERVRSTQSDTETALLSKSKTTPDTDTPSDQPSDNVAVLPEISTTVHFELVHPEYRGWWRFVPKSELIARTHHIDREPGFADICHWAIKLIRILMILILVAVLSVAILTRTKPLKSKSSSTKNKARQVPKERAR